MSVTHYTNKKANCFVNSPRQEGLVVRLTATHDQSRPAREEGEGADSHLLWQLCISGRDMNIHITCTCT